MDEETKNEDDAKNYLIEFDGEGVTARVVVDNKTNCETSIFDYMEDNEEVMFLFATTTEMSQDGDLKLAKMWVFCL